MYGTKLDPGSQVIGNVFVKNQIAVRTWQEIDVANREFTGNGTGFVADNSDDGRLFTRTRGDNVLIQHMSNGITAPGDGRKTTITRNVAAKDGMCGICAPGAIDGGGNVACVNKTGQYVDVKYLSR